MFKSSFTLIYSSVWKKSPVSFSSVPKKDSNLNSWFQLDPLDTAVTHLENYVDEDSVQGGT